MIFFAQFGKNEHGYFFSKTNKSARDLENIYNCLFICAKENHEPLTCNKTILAGVQNLELDLLKMDV